MSTHSSQSPFNLTPLAAGHMYLTAYGESAPYSLLLYNHLVDSVSVGQKPVWITSKEPHQILDDSDLSRNLARDIQNNQVQVLLEDASGSIDRLMTEIDYYATPKAQLIVIEQFQRYAHSPEQKDVTRALIRLRDWAYARECVVWATVAESDLDSFFESGIGLFSGMASLTYQGTILSWVIRYWLSGQHMISQRTVEVIQTSSQQLLIDSQTIDTIELDQMEGSVYDANRVIAVRGALGGQTLPAGWEVVNHNQDVLNQLAESIGCTFILEFTALTPLQDLTKLTYRMRRVAGSRIRIVVRELDTRLRASEENLLYQMGASLIVPTEVSFSRMLGLMSSQQGQVYSRPLPTEFDKLWNQSVLPGLRGYQQPGIFVENVKRALNLVTFHIHHPILVLLQLDPDMKTIVPWELMHAGRSGDIYTVFDNQLVLYLHSCQPSHLKKVLDQLLQRPAEEISLEQKQIITIDQIRLALTDMAHALDKQHVNPDSVAKTNTPMDETSYQNKLSRSGTYARPHPLPIKSQPV